MVQLLPECASPEPHPRGARDGGDGGDGGDSLHAGELYPPPLSLVLYYPLLGLLNGHPSPFFVFSFKLACLVA
jgi:hypothetical protein